MQTNNPYTPPNSNTLETELKIQGPVGLGGWLTLVGINVVLRPLRMLFLDIPSLVNVVKGDAWHYLGDPSLETYIAGFKPLIIGELIINFIMLISWLGLSFLFFTKKRLFKNLFIVLLIALPIVITVDSFLTSTIFPETPTFDAETMKDLLQSIVFAGVWCTYILKSKRVANTFVN